MSLDFSLYKFTEGFKDDGYKFEMKEEVFTRNITHNLNTMAKEANIYYLLWRPDEAGARIASDIIPDLEVGLKLLKSKPEYFKQFNAENGWGTYKYFVPFVESVLEACKKYPDATIEAYR